MRREIKAKRLPLVWNFLKWEVLQLILERQDVHLRLTSCSNATRNYIYHENHISWSENSSEFSLYVRGRHMVTNYNELVPWVLTSRQRPYSGNFIEVKDSSRSIALQTRNESGGAWYSYKVVLHHETNSGLTSNVMSMSQYLWKNPTNVLLLSKIFKE